MWLRKDNGEDVSPFGKWKIPRSAGDLKRSFDCQPTVEIDIRLHSSEKNSASDLFLCILIGWRKDLIKILVMLYEIIEMKNNIITFTKTIIYYDINGPFVGIVFCTKVR